MVAFIIRLLAVAAGLWLAAEVVPGVGYRDLGSLLLAALVLGLVNALVKPMLVLLTLPLTLITLGLFLLVINAAMIGVTAWLLPGFSIDGWLAAFLTWAIVAVASAVASALTREG